jgi:hypothetical protein
MCGQNPMASHSRERAVARGENLFGPRADRRLQGPKGTPTLLVVHEISNVLEQHELQHATAPGNWRLAKNTYQPIDYLLKR